MKKQTRTQNNN